MYARVQLNHKEVIMKTAAFVLCLAVSALAAQTAAAKPLTVKLRGHVTGWSDSSGTNFGGQVTLWQVITLTYTYDTDAPDRNADPKMGYYYGFTQPPTPGGSLQVKVGSLVFESVPASPSFSILVQAAGAPNTIGEFGISSNQNQPVPPGGWGAGNRVDSIYFHLTDPTNQFPTSDALPTDAPEVQRFGSGSIWVAGNDIDHSFNIQAQIDSAEVVPPAIEVMPADGRFLSQQRFDAGVLLPIGAQVYFAHASVGGNALPLSYPGTCQLAPPTSTGRTAILCPDAHTVLGTAAGAPIDWQVELTDGTVLTQSVKWQLIQ